MTSVTPLTRSRRDIPACCVDCVYWQTLRGASDSRRKTEWARDVESRFGAYGRVLSEGDDFRGMLQYGPANAFPRAQALPAGPPDAGAALITCVFLEGEDPVGTCERLLLEALADLKARRFHAVEAFALRDDDAPLAERVAGHHTLLDASILTRLGFSPVRSQGPVTLMRLPVGGLVGTRERATAARVRRLLGRLVPPAETPTPA
jgi:hypothetical protein